MQHLLHNRENFLCRINIHKPKFGQYVFYPAAVHARQKCVKYALRAKPLMFIVTTLCGDHDQLRISGGYSNIDLSSIHLFFYDVCVIDTI